MSSRRSCKNDPDMFCYACGKFTLRQHRKSISEFVVKAFSQASHSVNKICETANRDLSETEYQTTESEEDDDNQDLDFSLPSCSNETTNKPLIHLIRENSMI